MSRHRALLFKVLADSLDIRCQLQRNRHSREEEELVVNLVQLDKKVGQPGRPGWPRAPSRPAAGSAMVPAAGSQREQSACACCFAAWQPARAYCSRELHRAPAAPAFPRACWALPLPKSLSPLLTRAQDYVVDLVIDPGQLVPLDVFVAQNPTFARECRTACSAMAAQSWLQSCTVHLLPSAAGALAAALPPSTHLCPPACT